MIKEIEIPLHSTRNSLSADEALKQFRETTMLRPTTDPIPNPNGDILPLLPIQTVEQEIQTDLSQER